MSRQIKKSPITIKKIIKYHCGDIIRGRAADTESNLIGMDQIRINETVTTNSSYLITN